MPPQSFLSLLRDINGCDFCASYLRVPPKPVVRLNQQARILIIAQAPGTRASASGLPFDDPSGMRLMEWLSVSRTEFYDETKFAFMPMGFCYPGSKKSGDLPPCKDCAPKWHPQVIPHLVNIKLTLLIGTYAHQYYLKEKSVTKTVKNWRKHLPHYLPLPHPSWHNNAWILKHSWFTTELLITLRQLVEKTLR